jgi:hypothetical protein
VSEQCPEDGLAGLPIDGPQALRLGQRQAQSRHFGVLGSNSARKVVFRVGARSDFEKSVRQWHDNPPPLPVAGASEARRARAFEELDGRRT